MWSAPISGLWAVFTKLSELKNPTGYLRGDSMLPRVKLTMLYA
jgi:hypothetical protein